MSNQLHMQNPKFKIHSSLSPRRLSDKLCDEKKGEVDAYLYLREKKKYQLYINGYYYRKVVQRAYQDALARTNYGCSGRMMKGQWLCFKRSVFEQNSPTLKSLRQLLGFISTVRLPLKQGDQYIDPLSITKFANGSPISPYPND